MTDRRRNLSVLALVAFLLVMSLMLIVPGGPFGKKTQLGLDLRGGVELIYQAEPTPQVPKATAQAVSDAINTIRKRTNALGVSDSELQQQGRHQVDVGLPGAKNAARAQAPLNPLPLAKPATGPCAAELNQLGKSGPPAGSKIYTVPQGIILIEAERPANLKKANISAGWYVVEDDSELTGSDIKDPKQAF